MALYLKLEMSAWRLHESSDLGEIQSMIKNGRVRTIKAHIAKHYIITNNIEVCQFKSILRITLW